MTKIYLAGPINGCNDSECNDWRQFCINSTDAAQFVNPMVRDYRGREDRCANMVVELDKKDIESCNVIIANVPKPSIGTAMEIMFAHTIDIPVVAVVPEGSSVSPWLRYHTKAIAHSYKEALDLAFQLL